MNSVEQSSVDLTPEQSLSADTADFLHIPEHKISGFDGGTRLFKEPSLYLSLAVVVIASTVFFSKTPTLFWVSLAVLSAVAVAFHLVAERVLFRAHKEFETFAAPFEGVFVVTFGSILPGAALLAYGIYTLSTSAQPNFFDVVGKLALLLVVPLFNLFVWASVRKGYLIRPRLVGVMNGLSLGLSACWTIIWLKAAFLSHGDTSCKFGWMLLLCTSPFLLSAAVCLGLDLWQKTEPSIGRITKAFSVLGALLSCLFVCTPMARTFMLQTLLTDAKQGSVPAQAKAIPMLRSLATDEDLRPSKHSLSGFALAQMLIPDRGLDSPTDENRNTYFKITGKPYDEVETKDATDNTESPTAYIGERIAGLSLAKSQLSGSVDGATLSGSLDWTLSFHNSTSNPLEARGEISLPAGAVVSRTTLWINGEPREGIFAATGQVQQAYQAVAKQQRDPLLVTMSAPNRILVQCFPVLANSDMKIRIGLKVPLQTADGKTASMEVPRLLSSNFAQPKRHRISLSTHDFPLHISGIASQKNPHGYILSGIVKTADPSTKMNPVTVRRATPFTEIATVDSVAKTRRFIVEKLQSVVTPAPKRLRVVLDSSAALKADAEQIKNALATIPPYLKPMVYFEPEPSGDSDKAPEIKAKSMEEAQLAILPDAFTGGQDNTLVLREALETTAEEPNSAVLWIHGPQPSVQYSGGPGMLDLVHNVRLYDLQIAPGENTILKRIKNDDVSNLLTSENVSHESTEKDVQKLLASWQNVTKRLEMRRWASTEHPKTTIITDPQTAAQVTCLWASEEAESLLAAGREKQAHEIGRNYRLVSSVTGAVVLDDPRTFDHNPAVFRIDQSQVGTRAPGLVGAPVDPRYGQSNEVGQMADFGYDTARDISRLATAISMFISLAIAASFLRGRKASDRPAVGKALLLVFGVPITVHVLGTFMINNFGGLGGGL